MQVWLVAALIAVIALAAWLSYRWFRAYRYTDAWRKGELRGAMLGVLLMVGGWFGYRLPPPPQTNVTFAAGHEPTGSPPTTDGADDPEAPPRHA